MNAKKKTIPYTYISSSYKLHKNKRNHKLTTILQSAPLKSQHALQGRCHTGEDTKLTASWKAEKNSGSLLPCKSNKKHRQNVTNTNTYPLIPASSVNHHASARTCRTQEQRSSCTCTSRTFPCSPCTYSHTLMARQGLAGNVLRHRKRTEIARIFNGFQHWRHSHR